MIHLTYRCLLPNSFCLGIDQWLIRFDNSKTKWATSWWKKVLGAGENPLAAAAHEFGHVFGIPHVESEDYVMHKEIGGSGKFSRSERWLYRHLFLSEQNSEESDE